MEKGVSTRRLGREAANALWKTGFAAERTVQTVNHGTKLAGKVAEMGVKTLEAS